MPDPEATLSGVSLLVVDDDPDVGAVLSLMLRDRGADVRLAGGVDEVLVEIARRRPDILLSDIGMPGKDDYALLAEVRRSELGRRLPAVAITSYARGQDKAQVLAQGFDAHCAKPIQPMELLRTLEGLLRRAT
jgi:CheY-like chemotaxis protein